MKTLKLYIQYWTIRVFFLILFVLIVFGSYFYSVPRFQWGSIQLNNIYYKETEGLPDWLYGAEYFIFTFFVISVLLIILITYYKRNKRIRKKIRHKYEDYFASGLVSYLYSKREQNDKDKNPEIEGFKIALKDDYAKRIFINTLRKIRAQTIGEVRDKTLTIYNEYRFGYLVVPYKVIFKQQSIQHSLEKVFVKRNKKTFSSAFPSFSSYSKLLQPCMH